MQWDLFCRVVDNFGDIGVCWRLAADLAGRGESVRLWVDDASALRWMAPHGARGVEVRGWPAEDVGGAADARGATAADVVDAAGAGAADTPADVVIEAFGCELPAAFVRGMAARAHAPLWINLEYLSAEDYVERAHRLPSPQTNGPGAGLRKWFFYPGFTPRTGGLIREPDLLARQADFDAAAWLQTLGAPRRPGERVVSLFCYEAAPVAALLDDLSRKPTLLLATPGPAARLTEASLGPTLQRGGLRAHLLPALTQRDYDHLLWASDLNFVRGEDSFVRAQWAGRPFVWQIYPQHDAAHLAKLDAFLARCGAAAEVRAFHHAWNGDGGALPPLPAWPAWRENCLHWRASLLAQTDLASQLLGFAAESR